MFCLKTYSIIFISFFLVSFFLQIGRGEAVIPNRPFLSSVSSQKEIVLPSACSLLSREGRRGCRLILSHLPHLASDAQTRSQTQSQRPKGGVLGRAVRRGLRSMRDATRSVAKRTCAASHRLRVETDRVDLIGQRWTADASKKKEKAPKSEKRMRKKERKVVFFTVKKKAKCQEQPKEQTVSTPQGRTMAVTPSYLLASLQRGLCVAMGATCVGRT